MTEASLISLFVRPLNRLRVPYLVTGGVASVVYGEPRFTRGIDLVVELRPRDAGRFAEAWSAEEFYVPPVDDEVFMAPIEAVILSKLRYYQMGKSDRHLRDIRQMLRVSGDLVDRPELERWAAQLGIEGEWEEAQKFQET